MVIRTESSTSLSSVLHETSSTNGSVSNSTSSSASSSSFTNTSNTLRYGDIISLAIYFNPTIQSSQQQQQTISSSSFDKLNNSMMDILHDRNSTTTPSTPTSNSPFPSSPSAPTTTTTTTSLEQIVGFLSIKGLPGHTRCGLSVDESILKSFDNSLFMVCQGDTYTARKKFNKFQSHLQSLQNSNNNGAVNHVNSTNNLNASSYSFGSSFKNQQVNTNNKQQVMINNLNYQNQLNELKERMNREDQENTIEKERSWGKPILYGQRIQLYHIKSGMYLNVLRSNADLEKSSLKLSLSEGDRMCHFQFAPHFKFRTEGEPIRLTDKVIIMNEKTKHSVHISHYKYVRPIIVRDFDRYEVNASSHPGDNIWILRLYRSYLPMDQLFIKGGDTIRIVHRDLLGALYHPTPSIENTSATVVSTPTTSSDESCSLNLNGKYSSSSITTLFQIEGLDSSRGGIMYYATPCRFKHVSTGKYIAAKQVEVPDIEGNSGSLIGNSNNNTATTTGATNNTATSTNTVSAARSGWRNLRRRVKIKLKLVLTDNPRDEASVFYLYSSENSNQFTTSDPILGQSLLRIKHAQSNTWLRANDLSNKITFNNSNNNSNNLMELWFDLIQREKDVFSMEHVNNTFQINLIKEIYPILTNFDINSHYQRNDIDILLNALKLVIYLCTDSIQEDPLKREGSPHTEIQNHFKEMNIIDAIFTIIDLLDNNNNAIKMTSTPRDSSPMLRRSSMLTDNNETTVYSTRFNSILVQMCYRAIKQLAKQNIVNCTHVLNKYFTTMQDHLSRDVGGQEVSNALVEIIHNNMEVLEQIPSEKINHFFKLITTRQKKPLFVSFLSNLCRCGERPVTKNQKHLVMLLSEIDCRNVFYLPEYDDRDGKIYVYCNDVDSIESESQVAIDEGVTVIDETKKAERILLSELSSYNNQMFRILIEGLSLLSSLCVGRHLAGINYVSELLPLDLVMGVVENESYGIELRSAMCEILEYCFLDNTSTGEWPAINLSRPLDHGNAREGARNTQTSSNKKGQVEFVDYRNRFKSLRLFLIEFFQASKNYQLEAERTPLIYNLVKISYKCLIYRIFNPYGNDSDSLQLKAKLEPTNAPMSNSESFKLIVEGQDEYLYSMKEMEEFFSALLKTLDSTNDKGDRATMFDDIEQNLNTMKIKKKILDIFLYAMDLRIDYRISLIITAYNARNKILITENQLNEFIKKTIYQPVNFFQFDNDSSGSYKNFAFPLLILFKYQNREIPETALKLLQRSFNQAKELKENLQKVSILISQKSRKAYQLIYALFNRIQVLVSTSTFTGGDTSPDFTLFKDTCSQLGKLMKEIKGTKSAFRNLGGHELILKCLSTSYPQYIKDRLSLCCIELLTEFVRGDQKNQLELFREFRFLLEIMSNQLDTTELLTEIVRENDQILLSMIDPLLIKLYLEKIISVGAKSYHLNFLRILTCDSMGHSIPANQNEIINNLKEDYRSMIVLYNEEDSMKERERMIKNNDHLIIGSDLNYHINLLYLLRDCTRDKVGLAEGSVQAILPFSEMLSHLTDCYLIPPVRDPMMKLLTELYFITEKESTQDLSDVKIWKLFQKINVEISTWLQNDGCMRYPKEFEDAYYSKYPGTEIRTVSTNNTNQSNSDETNSEEVFKRAFFNGSDEEIFVNDIYIFKVLLPFIESFFEMVFNKDVKKMLLQKENKEEIKTIIYDLLNNITQIYLHCSSHREDVKRCHMSIQKIMITSDIDVDSKFKQLTKLALAKSSTAMMIKQESNKVMKQKYAVKNIEEDFLLKYKNFLEELEKKGFFKEKEQSDLPKFAQLLQSHIEEYLPRLVMVLKIMIENGVTREMQETFLDSISTIGAIVQQYNAKEDYNFSVQHSIPELVLFLICSSNNVFSKHGLELGISTLDGGNIENQQLYNRLLRSGNYENFFVSIKNKIKQSILEEKEMRKRGATKLTTELTSYAWEVLRFLQLLCEGHNLENQQMLQDQSSFNRMSIDLVSECIEYVIHLFKYLSASNIDKVIQAFNSLNEFVQGPCEQSIRTLSYSSGLFTVFNDIVENDIMIDKSLQTEPTGASFAMHQSRSTFLLKHQSMANQNANLKAVELVDHITLKKEMNLLKTAIITLTSMLEGGNRLAKRMERKYLNIEPLIERMEQCADMCMQMSFIQSLIIKRREFKKFSSGIFEQFRANKSNMDQMLSSKLSKDFGQLPIEKKLKYSNDVNQYISRMKEYVIEECEEIGTSIYILLKYLNIEMADSFEDEDSVRRTIVYQYYQSLTGSIEIIRDSNIEIVNFKKPHMCHNLLEQTKDEFVQQCNRETAQTKVADLYEWTYTVFYTEMLHLERYRQNANGWESKTWRFLENYWKYMKNLSFLFSLCINIIVLISFHKKYDVFSGNLPIPGQSYGDKGIDGMIITQGFKWWGVGILVIVLGIIQLITTLLLILIYLRFFLLLNVKKKFELKKGETWEDAKTKDDFKKKLIINILSDKYLWWLIIYFLISLIGLFVTPLVYCLQLFEVVTLSHVLQDIVFSIFENRKKFFLFSILTIFSLTAYAFTVFAFKWEQWIIGTTNACSNTILCFATTINYSVRAEAFLENIMDPQPNDVFRFFMDIVFYFIVVVILLDVLFGLILDSFSERREARNKLEKEKKEICFICHNEKSRFDIHANEGINFETHIMNEHNMWNYVYFLIYLSQKPRDEYTGTEQYVELNAAKLSFFPTLRSRTLELVESGLLMEEKLQPDHTSSSADSDDEDENDSHDNRADFDISQTQSKKGSLTKMNDDFESMINNKDSLLLYI
ncbi:inositol 1,4,5-triphosphate receptor [Naegleria gruberi]|uniref:Inositol 1,4,5-triphosphate receptor n=1 Tax=Naegleria gruberi TaxID=5762 RepID=D2W2F5_NAEGR|nr:inositol 1,4,5-triphosphate receptor [Naegleria gruberi]EFC36702.1 inositol 1,4,5-triphosphate receptor [Naegleria gruberi]|eukprot:XP_002669446.1 inositol 1,4,5-triphosphate receptor [Naegleria gruberi strain NEG-M]